MRHVSRSGLACTIVVIAIVSAWGCGGGPGPSCHYSLTVNTHGLPANGGDVDVKVEAPAGCTWSFQGNVPWITVHGAPPAPSGSGNGTVVATLAANTGVRRVGTASIAFQQVTFDEAGTDGAGSCTFQVFPLTATVGPAGGFGAYAVVPNAQDCSWWAEARSPDDDFVDHDFSRGIGNGVGTYQFLPSTVLPTIPLPRPARIGLHNSANALIATHTVTQTP